MYLKLSLELPADVSYVQAARASSECLLQRFSVTEEDIDKVTLIIGELCTNAARHAQAEPESLVTLEVKFLPQLVDVMVKDRGKGFNRDQIPMPSQESESGRGLLLVESLSDNVEFHRLEEGGTAITAHVRIHYKELPH